MSSKTASLMPRGWDWFPWAIGASLAVTILVNGALAWFASATFPGEAASTPYEVGTAYNAVLAEAERQAALGWRLDASIEDGRVVARLVDRDGVAIAGRTLSGTRSRPLGSSVVTPMTFDSVEAGVFRSVEALPMAGQWEVKLLVRDDQGVAFSATRRLIAR